MKVTKIDLIIQLTLALADTIIDIDQSHITDLQKKKLVKDLTDVVYTHLSLNITDTPSNEKRVKVFNKILSDSYPEYILKAFTTYAGHATISQLRRVVFEELVELWRKNAENNIPETSPDISDKNLL
ncbi:MAG: hypothetical protein WC761_01725 [Candidatus Paceibacterota bacterium]